MKVADLICYSESFLSMISCSKGDHFKITIAEVKVSYLVAGSVVRICFELTRCIITCQLFRAPIKLEDRPALSQGELHLLPDIKLTFPGKKMPHLLTVVFGAANRASRHYCQVKQLKTD